MVDPRRLLDDPGLSPRARAVLDAAADDGPSPDQRRKLATALGLSVAATRGATAAAAASGLWWKVPVLVLGVLGAGTAGYVASRGAPATDAAPRVIAAPRAPAPGPIAPAIAPAITAPAMAAPAAAPTVAPAPITPPAPATRPARRAPPHPPAAAPPEVAPEVAAEVAPPIAVAPAPTVVDPRTLAAEVALLDRARVALQGGDTAATLAAVDRHEREFASGALVAEAALLRIQATLATGDRAGAAALAARFLQRFPHSPLAARARAIVQGTERSP